MSREKLDKEYYNNIPVYFCKDCRSLKIMTIHPLWGDYCADCSSTNIGKTNIFTWLELNKKNK